MTETTPTEMEVAYAGYLASVEAGTKIIEAHKGMTTNPEDANPGLWDAVEDAARIVAAAPITTDRDALLACACAADQIGELDLTNHDEDRQTTLLWRRAFAAANVALPSYLMNPINKGDA